MPTGVFWSFVLSCATDTMRWSSSMPKTVCATARTSRTVCFAGLLGSARTWTSIGSPRPVAHDADGVDAAQAAELVLEVAELGRRVSVPLGRQFVVRPLTRHGDPVTPRGPGAPARDTAYGHPTTLRGGRALPMLPVGLAWRSDPRETMRSFRPEEGEQNCLGVETAGPRPEFPTSYLKRSETSVGLTALPMRENSCFRGSRAKGHGSRCGRRVSIGRNAARRWRCHVGSSDSTSKRRGPAFSTLRPTRHGYRT